MIEATEAASEAQKIMCIGEEDESRADGKRKTKFRMNGLDLMVMIMMRGRVPSYKLLCGLFFPWMH